MSTLVHYYGLGKDESIMTFLYYCFTTLAVLYLIVAIPTMFICLGCIVTDFVSEFIIPKIQQKRYKKNSIVICSKENAQYHVCIYYHKQLYHFYNQKLYNAADIGDIFYVALCRKHNKLYLKIPYSKGKRHYIIKSKKLS